MTRTSMVGAWSVLSLCMVCLPGCADAWEPGAEGTGRDRAILTGRETREHPAVVELWIYQGQGVVAERCTGSLIAPTVVLTAAHCVARKPETPREGAITGIDVYFGSDSTNPRDPAFLGRIAAQNWRPNTDAPRRFPELDSFTGHYDTGLVFLRTPAPASVSPLPVALDVRLDRATLDAMSPEIVGFGATGLRTVTRDGELVEEAVGLQKKRSGKPHVVGIRVASTEEDPFDLIDGALEIRNGVPGHASTCRGDSGAPLLVRRTGGASAIVAVSSHGYPPSCSNRDSAYFAPLRDSRSFLRSVLPGL